MIRPFYVLAAAAVIAGSFALAPEESAKPEKKVTQAVAVVHPTKGQTASGVVKFERTDSAVKVTWEIVGLTPGKHGFHIHELGDCNCDDGKCAGGHFNPEGKKHGGPDSAERHVGDLGNIVADEKGVAKGEMTDPLIALHGAHSIVGRSVIVHEKADDLKSDPTGDAGGRIGIGVIGIAKEQ